MNQLVLIVLGLAAGAWFTTRIRVLPDAPALGEDAGAPPVSVSVIVPARDEELSLPRLLRSLAELDKRPELAERPEVIVVDDGSTDRTAELARAAGVRVIAAPEPPAGWLGKPWACSVGARAATGELLVFLDADTELGPTALGDLVAAHRSLAPGGLLSIQPHHRVETVYEHASAVPNAVSVIASGCFAPRAPRNLAMAFGPCLVTDATTYRAVGGHAAVASEVIEDLHLARAYRRAGLPVRALAGGSKLRYRMYPDGIGQLVEGWSKNLTGGVRLAPVVPSIAGALWVTAGLATCVAVARALVDQATGAAGPAPWWPALAWVAYAAHLRWVLHRIGSFRGWAAWLFVVPLLAFVLLFARSALHRIVRREVQWRRRTISWGRAGG